MNFTFDPETHIGKMGEEVWPSVTQLLAEFRLVHFDGVPKDILEKARIRGTRVHAATILLDECALDEEHFNGQFPECVPYLEAYRKFRVMDQFPIENVFKPGRMVSKAWRFHGEPDESGIKLLTNGAGENSLIDYKCTWKMYGSTGPQLSGYEMLLWEVYKIKVKRRYGLLLKKNGNYDLVPFEDPSDKKDFQACLYLHWQKRNKYKTSKGEFNDDPASND